MFDLKEIFNKFETQSAFVNAEELNSGHINDTYIIETNNKPFYVLQKVNHFVFKNVDQVIDNKISVSEYLQEKLSYLSSDEIYKKVLIFVKTKDGENYYKDDANNYWNLMVYIEDCVNFEKVPNRKIAYEAGKIYGEFLQLTNDFDATKLYETLPSFHSMSFRLRQFDDAVKNASDERKQMAENEITFVNSKRDEMKIIENLIDENKIPIRLTHNDTKISNVLFSKDEDALCVIDTDTVMAGTIHFDFGDAIRTICNTGFEDEKDLTKVGFNLEFYEAFVKGFFSTRIKDGLTKCEIDNLAFSAKTMTFIIALRFLTDFLNDDIYFKVSYETHNFDRAKNQIKLFSDMEKESEKMNELIQKETMLS